MPQIVLFAVAGAGAYVAYRVVRHLVSDASTVRRPVERPRNGEPRDLGQLRAGDDGVFRPEP